MTGQVILAGRTSEALDKTFGLVIFEAESKTAARLFMESDPAVVGQYHVGHAAPVLSRPLPQALIESRRRI